MKSIKDKISLHNDDLIGQLEVCNA